VLVPATPILEGQLLSPQLPDDIKIVACHAAHDDPSWSESYYATDVEWRRCDLSASLRRQQQMHMVGHQHTGMHGTIFARTELLPDIDRTRKSRTASLRFL